jgi:hypothetical protein
MLLCDMALFPSGIDRIAVASWVVNGCPTTVSLMCCVCTLLGEGPRLHRSVASALRRALMREALLSVRRPAYRCVPFTRADMCVLSRAGATAVAPSVLPSSWPNTAAWLLQASPLRACPWLIRLTAHPCTNPTSHRHMRTNPRLCSADVNSRCRLRSSLDQDVDNTSSPRAAGRVGY